MHANSNSAKGKPKGQKLQVPDEFESIQLHHRDRLISTLLQDRGALRLISAPKGYGKSVLAYEYMQRLFNSATTAWIDAKSPDFLRDIDAGYLIPEDMQKSTIGLIVIDDIPYLDEERADTLSDHIDICLYKGIEVIVTCIPSHDCLRSRLPDRVLISSTDLLVSEHECKKEPNKILPNKNEKNTWSHQKGVLFGLTPLAIWGKSTSIAQKCLLSFFKESLPIDFLRSVFCMLLLGNGRLKDLSRIGVPLRPENEAMIIKDYPFIDIDPIQHNFSCPHFNLCDLQKALDEAQLTETFIGGSLSLPEKALSCLIKTGNNERAEKILKIFCSDRQCSLWLSEEGWSLLDREELALVNALFSRCSHFDISEDMNLLSIYAWLNGLQGNKFEATHCAERVLQNGISSEKNLFRGSLPSLMAYLALIAFGEGGAAIFKKPSFKPDEIVEPEDYLAAIVDELEESEIMQSFCLRQSENSNFERVAISTERAQKIEFLITQGTEHSLDSPFMRLALHFLQFTNSVELRKILQNIGYRVVMKGRRESLETNTEALIIADIWRSGFFGVTKRGEDFRDARLLDEASSILNRIGMLANGNPLIAPWEETTVSYSKQENNTDVDENKTEKIELKEAEIPILHARLLGGFEINIGNKNIGENHWRKKSRMLLTILILGQGRDVTRDFIFEQLWPHISRQRATDNFYSVWSNVEKTLDSKSYIMRAGQFCKTDQRYVKSDVAEFESMSRRLLIERENSNVLLDIFARIETLYRGPLAPFVRENQYILNQRARLQSMYIDAMISASDHALEIEDPRVSLWFARKAMEEDPEREDVYYSLIRAQMANGQRCTAIRTFFQCKEYLRDELGLDPSVETKELYEQLISIDPSLLKLTPSSFKR